MSMSTTRPSLWASSTSAFSSSGVPNLLLACRKQQKENDFEFFDVFLMHNIRVLGHNVNEHPVGLVNKSLQLIRSAKPAAGLQETKQDYENKLIPARSLVTLLLVSIAVASQGRNSHNHQWGYERKPIESQAGNWH